VIALLSLLCVRRIALHSSQCKVQQYSPTSPSNRRQKGRDDVPRWVKGRQGIQQDRDKRSQSAIDHYQQDESPQESATGESLGILLHGGYVLLFDLHATITHNVDVLKRRVMEVWIKILQQSSSLLPFPGIFVTFLTVAGWTRENNMAYLIAGVLPCDRKSMFNMVDIFPLCFLELSIPASRIVAVVALSFQLFLYLLGCVRSRNSLFAGAAVLSVSLVLLNMSLLIPPVGFSIISLPFPLPYLFPMNFIMISALLGYLFSMLLIILVVVFNMGVIIHFPFFCTALPATWAQTSMIMFRGFKIFNRSRKDSVAFSTPPVSIGDYLFGFLYILRSAACALTLFALRTQVVTFLCMGSEIVQCGRLQLLASRAAFLRYNSVYGTTPVRIGIPEDVSASLWFHIIISALYHKVPSKATLGGTL
jgi:hypothetical protein